MERITLGIKLKHAKPAKKVLQAQQLHNKLKKNVEDVYDLLSCKKTHKEYKDQSKTWNFDLRGCPAVFSKKCKL